MSQTLLELHNGLKTAFCQGYGRLNDRQTRTCWLLVAIESLQTTRDIGGGVQNTRMNIVSYEPRLVWRFPLGRPNARGCSVRDMKKIPLCAGVFQLRGFASQ